MRTPRRRPYAMLLGLLLFALSGLAGCSDDEQVEEPVKAKPKPKKVQEEEPEEPVVDAEPTPEPDLEPIVDTTPAPPAEPEGFTSAPVTRFVTSLALNVRALPTKESPVVRYVKWGDQVEVVINGEWAKLGTGQYVSMNRLSETPPTGKPPRGKTNGKAAPEPLTPVAPAAVVPPPPAAKAPPPKAPAAKAQPKTLPAGKAAPAKTPAPKPAPSAVKAAPAKAPTPKAPSSKAPPVKAPNQP